MCAPRQIAKSWAVGAHPRGGSTNERWLAQLRGTCKLLYTRNPFARCASPPRVHAGAVSRDARVAYVEVLPDQCGLTAAGFPLRTVRWFAQRGTTVRRVLTDNGGAYRSDAFRTVADRVKLRSLRSRPYRPQTNGKVERFIQTMLREWAYVTGARPRLVRQKPSFPLASSELTCWKVWKCRTSPRIPLHGRRRSSGGGSGHQFVISTRSELNERPALMVVRSGG
jgi:transposase InsO family protein